MNEITVYAETCVPCTHKKEISLLRGFAALNNLKFLIKRTNYSTGQQLEAKQKSDLNLPFVYSDITKKSFPLRGINSDHLNELV